jgi:hypothetical protein
MTMTDASSSSSLLIPGETRIRDVDGFCGTVMYVGAVASAKNHHEVYAGIVWDDASRGIHDGSVVCRTTNQLVRHFSCGPTQGSFLKISKLDVGVVLDAALLKSKYVERQAPLIAPNNLLQYSARTSSGRDKPIEFLGEMQIRGRQQLQDITKISLRRQGIARACEENSESEQDLQEFAHIQDMDLAGNLLSNWDTVLQIVKQFPQLEILSLASNCLASRIYDKPIIASSFSLERLRVLNLNSCSIDTFRTIEWIGLSMPNLEELCVAYSDLSDLESCEAPVVGSFCKLKVLDCSSCRLSSWDTQVAKLAHLPLLEQLSLDDNPISVIPSRNDDEDNDSNKNKSYFASLVSLQMAGTAIKSWMDLEGINGLGVKSLRLKSTHLTSTMGQGEARANAVARFPNLDYLNGSIVSTQERTEAERRYVLVVTRLVAREQQQQQSDTDSSAADNECTLPPNIFQDYPQYARLREKHKDMVIFANSNGSALGGVGGVMATSVANVTILSMAPSSCSMEPLVRRLPGSLTVGRLKALCARAFGLDVDLMSLHFRIEVSKHPKKYKIVLAEYFSTNLMMSNTRLSPHGILIL